MKRILATLAAIALAGTAAADPLIGTWRTAADDNGNSGLIEVGVCDGTLCGQLVQAFDAGGNPMESENIGRYIIFDTRPAGDGEYRGQVYSPDREANYASRLTLSGDTLSVRGCAVGGLVCRDGGTWQRVN